jgi:hypothetical protein
MRTAAWCGAVVVALSGCHRQEPIGTAPTEAAPAVGPRGVPSSAAGTAPHGAPDPGDAQSLRVTIRSRRDWVRLPKSAAFPESSSAVAIPRALDPSGAPYVTGNAVLGADPTKLARGFRIDGRRFFVGEPLVVEHLVTLEGPGRWQEPIGGNYRGRGRDDNFAFVAVRSDGTVMRDPYDPEEVMFGGGLASTTEVTRGSPRSYFHAAQRYVVLDEPGKYDLYCLYLDSRLDTFGWNEALADAVTRASGGDLQLAGQANDLVRVSDGSAAGTVSPTLETEPTQSPLTDALPEPVRRALGDAASMVVDFAHFTVELRTPSAAERDAMVARWRAVAETSTQSSPSNRGEAARQAIWFARDDSFLPVIEAWLGKGVPPQDLHGLAQRPSPVALELLLRKGGPDGFFALRFLAPSLVPIAFPLVANALDDPDDGARSAAFDVLTLWSGERFDVAWDGFQRGRPTVEEARALKPAITAWWAAHGGAAKRP